MKRKFLSILLTLAMALTLLLTAAMAEVEKVAKVGENGYATLAEAVAAAKNGDTVTLLKNVTLNTPAPTFADKGDFALGIDKSITIDGTNDSGNYTITTNQQRGIGVYTDDAANPLNVTFKNLNVVQTNQRSCIETRGGIKTLTLDGVKLDATAASGNPQPLTIGGNQSNAAEVKIVNSTLSVTVKANGV